MEHRRRIAELNATVQRLAKGIKDSLTQLLHEGTATSEQQQHKGRKLLSDFAAILQVGPRACMHCYMLFGRAARLVCFSHACMHMCARVLALTRCFTCLPKIGASLLDLLFSFNAGLQVDPEAGPGEGGCLVAPTQPRRHCAQQREGRCGSRRGL